MTDKDIYNYLYSKIGNHYGVAGLMGNLYAESGLSSTNMENAYESRLGYNDTTYTKAVDNGTYTNFVKDSVGYGLAQWTYYTRKQNLLNYAKQKGTSIGDMSMQLEFLINELSNSYSNVLKVLKSATSVSEASNSVLKSFENPADQSSSVQAKRTSYGQGYYDKYASTSTTTTTSTSSTTTNIDITYQIWDDVKNKWLPNVTNDSDYAGIFGNDVCCVYANSSKGNVYYKAHYKGGKWLSEVANRSDYAGIYNKPIDGFMIKCDSKSLKYRVHLRRNNKWLPWVTGYNVNDSNNGYAGIIGQEIDAIQIK